MTTSAIKMVWRRQPNAMGLARVGQGERGWELWCGKESRVGYIGPKYEGLGRIRNGYFWVARWDPPNPIIPLMNTASTPTQTPGQAIADLEKYIRAHIPSVKINRAALTKAGIEIPKEQ